MSNYYVFDVGVDERKNNQEHIFHYEAASLADALAQHAEQVGTEVIAAFDRDQKTVGFRQWA